MGTGSLLLAGVILAVLGLAFYAARAGWRRLTGGLFPSGGAGPAAPARAEPLRGGPGRERGLAARAAEVDALVERAFELGDFGAEPELVGACRLALAGGKRLRSAAVLEIACAAAEGRGLPPVDAAEAALAVEYLHAASLVIDDLPAFDGDLVRRGRPSVHAAAGGAVAQMAAAALVAAAFLGVCRQVDWLRARFPGAAVDAVGTRLCAIVAECCGALGAASGQLLDSARGLAPELAARVAFQKTAPFFDAAFAAGWLSGGGGAGPALEAVRAAGSSFGFAFQVADDLGDQAADARRGAPNYAGAVGRAEAERVVAANLNAAGAHLRELGLWGAFWSEGAFPAVWGMCAPAAAEIREEVEAAGGAGAGRGAEAEAAGGEADGAAEIREAVGAESEETAGAGAGAEAAGGAEAEEGAEAAGGAETEGAGAGEGTKAEAEGGAEEAPGGAPGAGPEEPPRAAAGVERG